MLRSRRLIRYDGSLATTTECIKHDRASLRRVLYGLACRLDGTKTSALVADLLSLASSFALLFAPNVPILFVSKLLLGLSVHRSKGAFSFGLAYVITFLFPGLFMFGWPFIEGL